MLNCLYKDVRINALKIVEEGTYEYRKKIKLAGSKKELRCEDCDAPMFLRVCKNRQSHFAHWRGYGEECTYYAYTARETEQHRACKIILYSYFRELYPNENIELEYKAIPNRRSDIYIEFTDGRKLAVDIQRNSLSTASWDDKHNDYKKAGITDIWIILGQPSGDNERTLYFFQQIMLNESLDRTAIFLNVDNEEVTLVRKMNLENNSIDCDLYKRIYKLSDIVIMPDGRLESSFHSEFTETEEQLKKSLEEEQLRKKQQRAIAQMDEQRNGSIAVSFEQIGWSFDEVEHKDNESTYIGKSDRGIWKVTRNGETTQNSSITQNDETTKKHDNKASDEVIVNDEIGSNSFKVNTITSNVIASNTSIIKNNKSYKGNSKTKGIIRGYISKASSGESEGFKKLVELLHSGPNNYRMFMEVFEEFRASNNTSYFDICKEVLKKAGLG